MVLKQTWYGLLGLWRIPAFTISSLVLPVQFFAFVGLPNVGRPLDSVDAGAYLLASFGASAVGSMMVFNFGIGVASDRAARLDLLYRATPLPPLVYLAARLVAAVVFALVSLLLFGFGAVVGGRRGSRLLSGAERDSRRVAAQSAYSVGTSERRNQEVIHGSHHDRKPKRLRRPAPARRAGAARLPLPPTARTGTGSRRGCWRPAGCSTSWTASSTERRRCPGPTPSSGRRSRRGS